MKLSLYLFTAANAEPIFQFVRIRLNCYEWTSLMLEWEKTCYCISGPLALELCVLYCFDLILVFEKKHSLRYIGMFQNTNKQQGHKSMIIEVLQKYTNQIFFQPSSDIMASFPLQYHKTQIPPVPPLSLLIRTERCNPHELQTSFPESHSDSNNPRKSWGCDLICWICFEFSFDECKHH